MKTVILQNNETDIYIACPNEDCDICEGLGIDDPRKMLNALPIVHWETDEEDRNEVSHHKCSSCHEVFKVEWDYALNEDFDDD